MQFVLVLLLVILGLYAESKAVPAAAFYSIPACHLVARMICWQYQLSSRVA